MEIRDVYGDFPAFETERLILRKFTESDVDDIFAYSSEPDVSKYVPWETHQTIEDSLSFLNYAINQYEKAKLAPWAIELKQSKKVVGSIDFVTWSPSHQTAEMGFILSKEQWGKGIILEAASELMKFGFENMKLNRIEAPCMVENIQSKKVLRKLGMSFEGISREKYFIKGKYRDMATYAILKRDY